MDGATVGVQGRHAYLVQHINYIQTPPPSSAPFHQSRGGEDLKGMII